MIQTTSNSILVAFFTINIDDIGEYQLMHIIYACGPIIGKLMGCKWILWKITSDHVYRGVQEELQTLDFSVIFYFGYTVELHQLQTRKRIKSTVSKRASPVVIPHWRRRSCLGLLVVSSRDTTDIESEDLHVAKQIARVTLIR